MTPPFQCKVAAGIGESCSRVNKLSHLELGAQWQGKARHGPWLSLLAREGASGGELMSNDATHLAAQQQSYQYLTPYK